MWEIILLKYALAPNLHNKPLHLVILVITDSCPYRSSPLISGWVGQFIIIVNLNTYNYDKGFLKD